MQVVKELARLLWDGMRHLARGTPLQAEGVQWWIQERHLQYHPRLQWVPQGAAAQLVPAPLL